MQTRILKLTKRAEIRAAQSASRAGEKFRGGYIVGLECCVEAGGKTLWQVTLRKPEKVEAL